MLGCRAALILSRVHARAELWIYHPSLSELGARLITLHLTRHYAINLLIYKDRPCHRKAGSAPPGARRRALPGAKGVGAPLLAVSAHGQGR
jgi:hypothetical protein